MADDTRREDLWKLYDNAVAEYRFEVSLNNQRFQWYAGLNVAVLTVAAGLLRLTDRPEGRGIVVLAFLGGIVLAAFTAAVTYRQTTYYRNAREAVKKIAVELGVADWSVQTTDGFGAPPPRVVPQVRTINYLLLVLLAGLHASGIVYVAATG